MSGMLNETTLKKMEHDYAAQIEPFAFFSDIEGESSCPNCGGRMRWDCEWFSEEYTEHGWFTRQEAFTCVECGLDATVTQYYKPECKTVYLSTQDMKEEA